MTFDSFDSCEVKDHMHSTGIESITWLSLLEDRNNGWKIASCVLFLTDGSDPLLLSQGMDRSTNGKSLIFDI